MMKDKVKSFYMPVRWCFWTKNMIILCRTHNNWFSLDFFSVIFMSIVAEYLILWSQINVQLLTRVFWWSVIFLSTFWQIFHTVYNIFGSYCLCDCTLNTYSMHIWNSLVLKMTPTLYVYNPIPIYFYYTWLLFLAPQTSLLPPTLSSHCPAILFVVFPLLQHLYIRSSYLLH